MGYLRFDHAEILKPRRWITMRVGFERDLEVGERIELIDDAGQVFAVATVRWVAQLRADDVAYLDFDGYPTFFTTGEFLDHIQPSYPDRDVEPETLITAIALEDIVDRRGTES